MSLAARQSPESPSECPACLPPCQLAHQVPGLSLLQAFVCLPNSSSPEWLAYPPSVMGTACCPWVLPAISQILVSPFARSDRAPSSFTWDVSIPERRPICVLHYVSAISWVVAPQWMYPPAFFPAPFQIPYLGNQRMRRCKKPFAPHPYSYFPICALGYVSCYPSAQFSSVSASASATHAFSQFLHKLFI